MVVFPCRPHDKRPATAHGCKDATTDVIAIQAWWRENPNYNIGIATGAISGIFVLDVDGAEAALSRLEAQLGKIPPTVEVITARGRHLYFKYPDTPVGNTASKIADGIDTRGDGGYVLAPPSVHPSGRRYCWSVDSANAITDAPQWLLELLVRPSSATEVTPNEWRERFGLPVCEGRRNVTIAKLTGHLLRRYVDPIIVHTLMQLWNGALCQPPLAEQDVTRIVMSLSSKELQRRQQHG
jgi:hypothetical protein